jgi:hypothetical protein
VIQQFDADQFAATAQAIGQGYVVVARSRTSGRMVVSYDDRRGSDPHGGTEYLTRMDQRRVQSAHRYGLNCGYPVPTIEVDRDEMLAVQPFQFGP